MVAQKFLSPKQLAKKMAAFRGRWYKITQKSESLNNYVSGSDAGFKKAIQSILADLEKSKTEFQDVEKQLKHTFPELRNDIDDTIRKIIGEIDLFVEDVKNDMDDSTKLGELSKKLDVLTRDFKKVDIEYREFEKGSIEIVTRYFDMKNEYAHKEQQIANETKAALGNIKENFYEKAEPIVKEHTVNVGSEHVNLDTLFNMIVEGRVTVSKIMLIPKKKGLLGRKSQEDNKARSSVLKYVGGETLEDSAPIKKNEKRQIKKLDAEFSGLTAAEKEVHEMEMKLKNLEKPRDKITEQIARIKEDNAFRLLRQDEILEIRDNYISHFNQAHELVKEYLESSEKALADYEPPDTDLEKRELREKKKELSGRVKYLEEKLESTERELDTKTREFETAKDSLETDIGKLKDAKADLETHLDTTRSKLKETGSVRDDYKSQIANLTATKKSLESDIRGLEKDLSTLQKQFDDTKTSLETKLTDTTTKLKETESVRDNFKSLTAELTSTKKSLETDIQGREKDISALQKQLKNTEARLTTTEEQRDGYNQRSDELSEGLDSLKKDMAKRLKELESSMKEKVEDIKGSKE